MEKFNKITLRFEEPETEKKFQADKYFKMIKSLRISLICGIFIYGGFFIIDYFVFPDNFVRLLINRVFVSLIAFIIFFITYHKNFKKIFFHSIVLLYLIVGLGTIDITVIDKHYLASLYSVIVFFTLIPQLRLFITSIINISLLIIMAFALLFFSRMEMPDILLQIMLLTATIIVCGIILYIKETLERNNFIQTRQLIFQKKEIFQKNEELEKLSIVASKTDNAVIIMDASGNFKWINEGFTRMYGYTFEKLIIEIGKNIINTSANPQIKNILTDLKANKEAIIYESLFKKTDSKKIWAQTTLTPILNDKDEIIYLVAIDSDITKIKLAEIEKEKQRQEIAAQRDQLQLLNATKDKFFSIIAHDLKSPFNSILGFSNLLIRNAKNNNFDYEKNLVYANFIFDSANIAFTLLENLLTWSQSQRGVIKYNPDKFDLKKNIDRIISMYSNAALKKEINLSSIINKSLHVYADKEMVLTVLRNLISNAIKFSFLNSKIIISAKEEKEYLIVSVSDTGIGISEDAVKKLFEIDGGIQTEGTAKEKGTGLGLILCKEFVEKNNGKIWVESIKGEGSTFSFSIPNADIN